MARNLSLWEPAGTPVSLETAWDLRSLLGLLEVASAQVNWEPRAEETPGSCGTVLGLLKLASPGSILGPGFIGALWELDADDKAERHVSSQPHSGARDEHKCHNPSPKSGI